MKVGSETPRSKIDAADVADEDVRVVAALVESMSLPVETNEALSESVDAYTSPFEITPNRPANMCTGEPVTEVEVVVGKLDDISSAERRAVLKTE